MAVLAMILLHMEATGGLLIRHRNQFRFVVIMTALVLAAASAVCARFLIAERRQPGDSGARRPSQRSWRLLAAIWNFQWPQHEGNFNAGWEKQRREIVESMFDTVVAHSTFRNSRVAPMADPSVSDSAKVDVERPTLLFCCIGDFCPDLVQYMAAQRQIPINTISDDRAQRIEDFGPDLYDADFVFCAEPDTGLIADFLPTSPKNNAILDALRARPQFQQIGKWTHMKSTHSMFIFMRRDYYGFTPLSGLGDLELPTAAEKSHLLRWGYGPLTRLKVPAERAGTYDLYWYARTDLPGQIVTVKLNGKEIRREPIAFDRHNFSAARIPLDLKAGDNELEFVYAKWHTEGPPPLGVLFRHLQIDKPKKEFP